MSGRHDWVEIIEPTSREKMFANPTSGEIVFTPPEGAVVRPMSDNQWWELFDSSTDRNYYYNAITGDTVWNRPGGSADVISLTKLQSTSAEQSVSPAPVSPAPVSPAPVSPAPLSPGQTLDSVAEETNGPASQRDEVFHDVPPRQALAQQQPVVEETDHAEPYLEPHPEPARKLSEMLLHEIEPLSPLQVDFPDPKFGTSNDLNTTQEQTAHAQPTTADVGTSDIEMRQNKSRTLFGSSNVHYQEHDRGSWVNIKLVDPHSRSSAESGVSDGGREGGTGESRPEEKRMMVGSLDRAHRGRDNLLASSNAGYEKSYTMDNRGSKRRQPARPAPGLPNKSHDSKVKSPSHPPSSNDKGHVRARSDAPPAAPPAAPPFRPPVRHATHTGGKVTKTGTSLAAFQDLAQHRSGFFRKKVTIANMLSWTKESIKQPMIQTRDKQQKKEAVELFRLLQQYMGDRKWKVKDKDVDLLALEIATRAWEKKGLRDEIYIQLCRQTSCNEKPKSLEKGWEIIAICLAFFPPSIRFRSYLEGYLWRHVEPLPENKGIPVEVFAQYCHKKIEKMAQSGAKKGLKKPSIEEVVHAKRAPFHPSMFGTSLEEVMDMQKEKFPEYRMPWVVHALVDAILQLQGPCSEGIFRVPGDIDEVNILKLQMDKGLLPMDSLHDPYVPASLLKLWFRELEEPLIPEVYYQDCIDNCENGANALSLIESLPDLNRSLLFYLVNFLKQFVTVENIERTKMGVENIAMVWAPNFLRCPSEDHALIFQNTRKEMAFLRLLLNFLDTERFN